MSELKSLDNGYHKDFLTAQPSTELPNSPSHRCTSRTLLQENSSRGISLPKSKQSTGILFKMKPFFRNAVTVQLLGEKSSTGQQCFKLVRDLDGELISAQDPRSFNKRYEQTLSWNRINLTRRIFPDIVDNRFRLIGRGRNSISPFKNGHQSRDASCPFAYIGISNKERCTNDFHDLKERGRQTITPTDQQISTNTKPKKVEHYFSTSRLGDVRFLDSQDTSTSLIGDRCLESPFFTRDHGTSCSRMLFSRGHTNTSMSPDSYLCPEVIKIVPQRKDPTLRMHESRREKKRRLGSNHVFAPPPSPDMPSKYSCFGSETGSFVRPKRFPFKGLNKWNPSC